MKMKVTMGDPAGVIDGMFICQYSPDVYFVQVDTVEKWPEYTLGSGCSSEHPHFQCVSILAPNNGPLIQIDIIPETPEELKFFKHCHRAEFSHRYGPSFYLLRDKTDLPMIFSKRLRKPS